MKTILIMEDNPDHAALVSYHVKKFDYEPHELHDPQSFLETVDVTQPDAIIMDISLPGIDGVSLIRHLRYRSRYPNTPVIILSALSPSIIHAQCKDLNVSKIINKPLFFEDLAKALEQIFSDD